jgi:cold shock CspA family protein
VLAEPPPEPQPEDRPAGVAADSAATRSTQATVSEFDPGTGAGAVLHDNGRREEFPTDAFQAGGLRLLRLGQRVRLDYAAGELRKVTLITLP